VLTVNNLSAGYGGLDVIHEVTFNLAAGECLSIVGPNGCGKSTLLKALSGLLPFKGEAEIGGMPIRTMNASQLARQLAMLGQSSGVYFSYTVFDTVMMGRYPHKKGGLLGLPTKKDEAVALDCIQSVGLLDERDREITKLSGGQLQRVFLARTLAQQPRILLLDEPANHLDLRYQTELVDHLKNWAGQKSGAAAGVFHDLNLAIRFSGRLMVMEDGRVRALGAASEIIQSGLLEEVYKMDVAGYMRACSAFWECEQSS